MGALYKVYQTHPPTDNAAFYITPSSRHSERSEESPLTKTVESGNQREAAPPNKVSLREALPLHKGEYKRGAAPLYKLFPPPFSKEGGLRG
jgi:hypothetical protein